MFPLLRESDESDASHWEENVPPKKYHRCGWQMFLSWEVSVQLGFERRQV